MTRIISLPAATNKVIEECVEVFKQDLGAFKTMASNMTTAILNSSELAGHIHSVRSRTKDPFHLKDKLERKAREQLGKGRAFSITPSNLYKKIHDLAGVRILHLHTEQAIHIDAGLRRLLDDQSYELIEGPIARTWDDEYRQLFMQHNFEVAQSPSMYTSVHYVVLQNRRNFRACEIQLRTLMEEVWGEVSHTIDYPHPSKDLACREQIKVLARATSTCTRLVDSIFRSHEHGRSNRAVASRSVSAARSSRSRSR